MAPSAPLREWKPKLKTGQTLPVDSEAAPEPEDSKATAVKRPLPPGRPVITGPPRKVFACGDVRGNLKKLFSTVNAQVAKVGPFDALLCVGSLVPCDSAGSLEADLPADSAACLKGEERPSIDMFFVDSSPALLQASPEGRQFGERLHFLGGYGVREICGLRVAFLSGRYDAAAYETADADFVGPYFTARAISELQRLVFQDPWRRGIDVLLTCEWPMNLGQKIPDEASRPQDPDDSRPSWYAACSAPVAELCAALEPRYHLFGTADLFYQRPPFQAPRKGHACRCIGLGMVGSAGKQRKWLNAFSMLPMEQMTREELRQLPPNVTPCPFLAHLNRKRTHEEMEGEEVEAKRRVAARTEKPAPELSQQAVAALLAGNSAAYRGVASQLKEVVTACGVAFQAACPVATPAADVAQAPTSSASTALPKAEESSKEAKNTAEDTWVPLKGEIARSAGTKQAQLSEEERKAKEEKDAVRKAAAEEWLKKPPKKGVIRYTFKDDIITLGNPLGLRFSKDVPPWILEVKDGSLAAKKAPRVPVGGIVLAINGMDLSEKDNEEALLGLKKRPVILDVEWPEDQGLPTVRYA
eukprot:gnl/TRDRNA2_/TRDRNA2_130538_c0_seq2.p1 gnl/TRDRNA2_/TRDRNA2_130538_c0~~gnl/TRDRNA2_/TRDRNA2_130538_c0_seq2.p1  ORF type:complete len:600 (-),score=137.78 gnl/TRDRNA2_/TRDRNA2_130538_c0_seq2:89-1840(-)